MTTKISTALLGGIAGTIGALCAGPALAQDLATELTFSIVELTEQGEERLVERDSVRPGEVIEYALVSRNLAEEADLEGLVVGAPVPEGTTLLAPSHTSSVPARFEIQADLDPEAPGLEWSGLPAFRTVYAEDGSPMPEPLPDSEIVAMRWSLDASLPAGATARNTYRLVVN
ncbi:hypothetical protein [Limimaricola sp.]|uniref:hypothetical protein n=1 Tax=Limimaricola sp. TaxID=2211665 RepID=UPI0040587F08